MLHNITDTHKQRQETEAVEHIVNLQGAESKEETFGCYSLSTLNHVIHTPVLA